MPQVFKIAGYTVYFWVNENDPLEPVHVHIAKGVPSPNATKIWITKNGKCLCAITIPKFQISNSRFLCRLLNPAVSQYLTYGIQHSNKLAFTVKK